MQRLNAIFSFIENSYSVHDKYFDTKEFSRAKLVSDDEIFIPYSGDKNDFFDSTICANILDYQLAITTFPIQEEDQVTDVFGRINSGGKQLSSQKKRQAGMTNDFSMIVRKISSEIRGDSSEEILSIVDMPEISIDSSRSQHG